MTTVGIIGAGQLGQMLGFAAHTLGMECVFLDPSSSPPAAAAGAVMRRAFDDLAALNELASTTDVITYEFENVPVDAVRALPQRVAVYPPPQALEAAQDRWVEKRLFRSLGIPTPEFHNVESEAALHAAADALGFPFVLKTRRMGYDGKGQARIETPQELEQAWRDLGQVPLLAEAFVGFDFEVSAIGARDANGATVSYPLTENRHQDGILRSSRAPAGDAALTTTATRYHRQLLEELDYVGVLALELFVVDGRLMANEFAPRVHNSGHWTIEGTAASQFENHMRAVTGRALGDPTPLAHAGMENLLGEMPERLAQIRELGAYVHDYGKTPRPGRKLGHATVVAPDAAERDRKLAKLREYLHG